MLSHEPAPAVTHKFPQKLSLAPPGELTCRSDLRGRLGGLLLKPLHAFQLQVEIVLAVGELPGIFLKHDPSLDQVDQGLFERLHPEHFAFIDEILDLLGVPLPEGPPFRVRSFVNRNF